MEHNDEQIAELLTLVGGITVSWAILERALDLCIHSLFHYWGVKDYVSEMPRTALSKKVEFLKDAFKPGTLTDTLFPGMGKITTDIEELGNLRHQCVHGAASMVFAADGSSVFRRLQRRKDGAMIDVVMTTTPAHLTEVRNQIHLLAMFITNFADILDSGRPNQSDEPDRERSV